MGASDPTKRDDFQKKNVAVHRVKRFVTHSEYNGTAYKDIGIIETLDRIEFREANIWPLCLPKEASENADEFANMLKK